MLEKRFSFAVAALAAVAAGCGPTGPAQAPASGRVTIDGEPFTNGRVRFAPVAPPGKLESGKAAFGSTDAEGRFVLGIYAADDGAVVGEHWATVVNTDRSERWDFEQLAYPERLSVTTDGPNEFALEFTSSE